MSSAEAAELLLAAGRELRLRRFMGRLPFDVDDWMRKGLESDLPEPGRLDDRSIGYHFEVRSPTTYGGTFFKLRCGLEDEREKPQLMLDKPYPANLEGFREMVAAFDRFDVGRSVFAPTYIWLHPYSQLAREANHEYQARLNQVMRRTGWGGLPSQTSSDGPAAAPRRAARRRRWWPWGRG